MKKQISLFLVLCFSILKLSAQTWAPCASGVGDPVNCLGVYSGNLYITNYTNPNPGDIDRWNGTTMTNVYNSIYQYGDLAASGSTIYTTGLSSGQGLYNSPTGNFGSWTQIGTLLGGPDQICWFNSQLYRASSSQTSRLVGTSWTNLVGGSMAQGPYEAKVNQAGTLLYYCGRIVNGPNYNGFRTVDVSNNINYYGPNITSGQSVVDFVFHGSDLYACINGIGGGFYKQNGSSWTTILNGYTGGGRCESYGGKLYFTANAASCIVYCYDPTQPISGTNPISTATVPASGYVTDMAVYNNSLYFGGTFTSFNTVSSGIVSANNIIRFSVPFPASSFTTSPGSLCGLGTMTTTNTSTGATSYQWYVNGTPYSTSTNTTVNASLYTSPNPYVAGTFSVTLTAINGLIRDSVTQVINTLANPMPPTISALGSTTFCAGGSTTLQCSASPNYSWSTGATTQNITVTTSGTFSANAVGTNGCITPSTNSITVTVNPLPTPTVTQVGADLTTGIFSSYQWLLNTSIIPTATSQTYTPTSSGNYQVIVTDSNGCSDTSSVFPFIFTGIYSATLLENYSFSISGNDIQVTFNESAIVEIYDALGRKYYSSTQQSHLVKLPTGVYVLRSNYFVRKIVVP